MDIEETGKRSKIHVKFTDHARIEMLNDNIRVDDILAVVNTGEVIEKYPDDKPFPSCLVYANVNNIPIHVVCAMPQNTEILIIVTTYLPDPDKWINHKVRKI